MWAADGSRSPGHRLSREANTSVAAGKRIVGRARALTAMPATRQAVQAGDLSVEHIDLLADANSRTRGVEFADQEATLVDHCKQLRFDQARKVLDYWKFKVDELNGDDGDDPTREGREASIGKGINGELHLKAIFDAVGGAVFKQAWERIERDLRLADHNNPDAEARTVAQRRADALVEMAVRASGTQPDTVRPRPSISVIVGDDSFKRLCELADGTVIAPSWLIAWVSDADVETLIYDGPFYGVAKSSQRNFTGALRRIIEARDRHCQHPSGCDQPLNRCDIDH